MDQFNSLYNSFGGWIYKILPLSPFQQFIERFAAFPYLGELNWFFPIREAVGVMGVWLTVVTTYFVYQWILRWVRVVS